MKKIEFFKIEGDRITRIRKHCPKCGPAVFLADHKNRFSCGKCGYAEFKGGGRPPKPPAVEEKSIEQPVQQKPEPTGEETSIEGKAPESEQVEDEINGADKASLIDVYKSLLRDIEPIVKEEFSSKKPVSDGCPPPIG